MLLRKEKGNIERGNFRKRNKGRLRDLGRRRRSNKMLKGL